MSEVASVEGLGQAFPDSDSRIRLNGDPESETHAMLEALAWEGGGFLDGARIRFDPNLNVLIGGRGTGKSTVIESIRYALGLECLGEDAGAAHRSIVRQVLRAGTRVSLAVRSPGPSPRRYVIRRTVPHPPVVSNEHGEPVDLLPGDVLPRVEVYGQHEISEMTGNPEKLTRLLGRFVGGDPAVRARRKREVLSGLRQNRREITAVQADLDGLSRRLEALPGLEETLGRYRDAGLEDQLEEKTLIIREERIVDLMPQRLHAVEEAVQTLRQELPVDRAFLSPGALGELPGGDILATGDEILKRLSGDLESAAASMDASLAEARKALDGLRSRWDERKRKVDAAYEQTLRQFQKSAEDAEEFIRIRRLVEALRPLRDDRTRLERLLHEHRARRRRLLGEWEDLKERELHSLKRAALRVSEQLCGHVRVRVSGGGDSAPLADLLGDEAGGCLREAISGLDAVPDLSLPEFVARCRAGADALQERYDIPPGQARLLSTVSESTLMRMEEVESAPRTEMSLNTATVGSRPSWKTLGELSRGQKATAVLLLLLLEADAPLIIDQPEDDLDNRFITEAVVPIMRREKHRRQFVFSTHNANIPVLGDAELIAGLDASGEAQRGRAFIAPERTGSIDKDSVRDLVEETLEGGREAFETRRLKYGI